jgi:hypothetical protein
LDLLLDMLKPVDLPLQEYARAASAQAEPGNVRSF